ncbi:MAG TPA: class I SAM-dependent methyltransferase [Armatimonadota bacterium]|jgi:ubiquinone/menaquinone biosynthesis C-methylase UbiE
MPAPAEVFTPLADDYARYRPGYPAEMLDELAAVCGLAPDWAVADVGSGTGNLARLLLAAGHSVAGVEPNREMREAGERQLAAYPAFRSLNGAAEAIPLPDRSVDIVTVGQALHWFDVDRAKAEFRRILRGDQWVAVVWNDRLLDDDFAREYNALTHTAAMRPSPCAAPLSAGLDRLFDAAEPQHAGFPHSQRFDLPGMLGRARSSGYLPPQDAPDYAELAASMADLFNRHQRNGEVSFHYLAQLYVGRLDA